MKRHPGRRLAGGAVPALVAIVLVAACGGTAGSPAAPLAVAPALQVELVNSQLWPGVDDVLFDLLDERWSRLHVPPGQVHVALRDPGGAVEATLVPDAIALAATGRPLYRARVDLDRPGTWRMEVRADLDAGPLMATSELVVAPDSPGTPSIGARVPVVDTPVGDAVPAAAGVVAPPAPDLERVSVADALAAGRPFLFVVDTLLVPSTEACGSGLSHVVHLAVEFPDVLMIHAEPYRTRVVDGLIALDAPDGTPVVTPWAEAWGAGSPPWVFVVDGEGTLRAKFSGVMGTDELRAAIATVEA